MEQMQNLIELNETNFEPEVLRAAGPVLVDFYATWCGPCRILTPFLEQLAGRFSGRVKFAKLDVDDAPELVGRYDITGVPTLMLFRNGRVIDRSAGLPAPRVLKASLENAANPERSL